MRKPEGQSAHEISWSEERSFTPREKTQSHHNSSHTEDGEILPDRAPDMLLRYADDPNGMSGNPFIGQVVNALIEKGGIAQVEDIAQAIQVEPETVASLQNLTGVFDLSDEGALSSPLISPFIESKEDLPDPNPTS